MGRRPKEYDDADSSLEAVLARIEKTKGLKDRIRKELGLIKEDVAELPDDIYEFLYKKPDLSHSESIRLHGKCVTEGQSQLAKWGYEFIRLKHFPKSEERYCFVTCEHCGKQLDSALATKREAEKALAYKTKKAEMQEELDIRREWEAEQVLLGKL